jgi:hypothetical protein
MVEVKRKSAVEWNRLCLLRAGFLKERRMNSRSLFIVTALAMTTGGMYLGGCATERHDVVPPTALLGAEGERRLSYTTDGPGTIYVYDQLDNRLVYSGEVDGKRTISVDPDKNELHVDGTLVQDKTLKRGHNHRIFFQPRYR